ncbi:hypothetical protein MASR2M15_28910 [Anaerolineales bacterium]
MANQWFQHTIKRRRWQPRSQLTAFLALGIVIALIFGVIYLSQVATFATSNRQIEDLIAERDRLERTNEQLRAEIASLQTVPRLLARAQELGFRAATAENIEYLVVNGYDPDRKDFVPTQNFESEFVAAPVYDETFSGWLEAQLDSLRSQFEKFGTGAN